MKHRYIKVGHNAWAAHNAGEEISKIIDGEMLERIINEFNPEIGVGNYTIKQIVGFFKRKQLMGRYGKIRVNPKFYSKIKI